MKCLVFGQWEVLAALELVQLLSNGSQYLWFFFLKDDDKMSALGFSL